MCLQTALLLKMPVQPTTGGVVTATGGVVTTTGDATTPSSAKSGATTGSGSICVPPRRRKLYIHDIQSLGVEVDKAPSQEDLLKWFVESAAVETFFLWHKFKEQWRLQKAAELQRQAENAGLPLPRAQKVSPEDEAQKQLNGGKIPPDFLRQMFYTLGDYRDICVGEKTMIEVLKASGDNNIETINNKIKEILNRDNKKTVSGQEPSDEQRKSWWEKHGKDIWEGMIYALTYNTDSGAKDKPPEHLEDVEKAFFGTQNGKPVTPVTNTSTYKTQYEYETVELKEDNTSSAMSTSPRTIQNPSSTSENKPTLLTQFVKLPPFFRWLHEWGSDFCGKRARMLEKIKGDCEVEESSGGSRRRD
ncbi:hypothetical protein PFMALIP_05943, partial [Plasmodium falciparum MaliPS096_E11]